MSVTHKALQSHSEATENHSQSHFNPLAESPKNATRLPLYLIGFILLLISAVIIMWPTSSVDQPLPVSEQTTEPNDQTATSIRQTEQAVSEPDIQSQPHSKSEQPVQSESVQLTREPASEAVTETIATALETQAKPELKPTADKPASTQQQNSAAAKPEPAKIVTTKPTQISHSADAEQSQPVQTTEEPARLTQNEKTTVASTETTSPGISQSINQWQQQVGRLIEQGEIERAEAVLKNWIVTAPNDPQPRIWLARIYINNQVYRSAEPLISQLKSADAKALLGVIYERTSRPAQAATLFEELYRNNPTNHKWLLFWAINSENSGKLANAGTLYQTYLNQFSNQDAQLTTFVQQRLRSIQGQ